MLQDYELCKTFVFLILYVLQPFGVNMYNGNKLLVSLLFGVITFGCCLLFELAKKPLHKRITPWLVWHEALSVLANVLFIGFCNFIACSLIFHYPISFGVFLQFLYWAFVIGIIITVFSVGFSYYRHLRNQLESLIDKTTEEQADVVVTIRDNSVRGNDLQLPINDLLYIEAQKNNVSVCYMKDDKAQTSVLHTTLTSVLTDLQDYENIFQCHRSFVVNLNNLSSARGNSNGYQLKLGNATTIIPVSRTYVPKLRSFIA